LLEYRIGPRPQRRPRERSQVGRTADDGSARRIYRRLHDEEQPLHTELIRGITIRPLRNGETGVVQAVFDALGPRSRRLRFGGGKNVLSPAELAELARVDGSHHVLVALVDCVPVGIARLVAAGGEAEVAVEVADEWQGRRVGTILMTRLAADARAAGIERLHATVSPENTASRALMRRAAIRVSVA
jgi:GNAT superfamily N-acetyltransferase